MFGKDLRISASDKSQTYTFHHADEAALQQAIERLQIFETELRDEGFRQVSSATINNERREMTLTGRHPRLGKVDITLWTDTRLEVEDPHIGAGFHASIRNEAADAAWEELSERFRQAVYGRDY